MRKSITKKSRWTLDCSDDIKKPKKPSHLVATAERLGPFKFETQNEAVRHGHSVMLGDQRCGLSRELAEELVKDLAIRFNTEEHLARGAPRFREVLSRLKAICDQLAALADALDTLDDISRYELLGTDLDAEANRSMTATRAHSLYVQWVVR